MDKQFDVIVIGAGIAGASAASEIAADASVLLLDMESAPGYHATGRSAAYFAPAYGNATVRNLTAASTTFYYEPPAGFSDVPLLRPRKALFVGRSSQVDSIAAMQQENPALQYQDGDAVVLRVPIIDPGVIDRGLLDPVGGDLDVDAILQGYLRAFRERGGELLASAGVTDMAFEQGQWHIATPQHTATSPYIINAAGAWADNVASLAGLAPLGIVPKRRTAILVDGPTDMDFADWPLVIDVDEQFYFKPDAGQLLVSPADESPSAACDAQPEELDVAIAVDRVCQATNLDIKRINHRWAGLRSFAPDKTFVVGFDPRAKGFFWLAGQGGYGVQSAPGMAQLARHLALGTSIPAAYARIADSIGDVSPERLIH